MERNYDILDPYQKLGLVIMASQDDTFYPLAKLSYDEIVSFEAKVKRTAAVHTGNGVLWGAGDKVPAPKGVSDAPIALRLTPIPPTRHPLSLWDLSGLEALPPFMFQLTWSLG